ncbi:hypothetical protein SAMN05192561_101436 [Halopenitus malekzadehii]|uniref:Cell division protein A N-terminal domain-containing protein n=1 Tax=Halopenitus malekzadehii TaxID=1267564 RepID=A0A1H6HX56_9EURY|nr:hypothetical protein [Halopenitus malekzadehii]SEH38917.1 hypothetical protein SAMN05192561_101436 [Halopenitus malekzadehii]
MTSLSEVYGGRGRSTTSLRRLYLGVGLFAVGILCIVAGILAAGTEIIPSMEAYTLADARWYGGIVGGVGLPLAMLGVMSVLPADRRTRAAALVGASIMALGVVMFSYAYPYHWVNSPRPALVDLTLPTAGIYFLGGATTFWCLFVGVANFKTRNDPGGSVTLEVTHKGETKVVEVDRRQLDEFGGVGLLGGTPDGSVETQTNDPDANTLGGGDADVSHADATDSDTADPDSAAPDTASSTTAGGGLFGGSGSSGSSGGTNRSSGAGGTLGSGAASVSDGGSDPESIRTPTGSDRSSTGTDADGGSGFSTEWPDPGRNRTDGSGRHRSGDSSRDRSPDRPRERNRTATGDQPSNGSTRSSGSSGSSELTPTTDDDEDVEFIE